MLFKMKKIYTIKFLNKNKINEIYIKIFFKVRLKKRTKDRGAPYYLTELFFSEIVVNNIGKEYMYELFLAPLFKTETEN